MRRTRTDQVAENIRIEAARRRLPQKAIARAIGMSQQSLSQRMLGRVPFNVNEIDALARFFEISVEQLCRSNVPA